MEFFKCGRLNTDFSKFMACPHDKVGEELRQCHSLRRSHFFGIQYFDFAQI